MPYLYSEEQHEIRNQARRLLGASYSGPRLKALLSEQGAYDAEYWQSCARMGWTAITVPEAYGGLALGLLDLAIIAEETGRVAVGAPFLASGFAVTEALRRWGSDTMRAELLPGFVDGTTIGCHALIRPSGLTLRAGRLHGTLTAVVAGVVAHWLITAAADETGAAVLVLADLAQAGVTRTPIDSFDNSRCTASVTFAGVEVIGAPLADPRAAVAHLLAALAVIAAFEQIGGAEATLAMGIAYANERQAFGQAIGKFQSIKHRLAEMYIAIELARGAALAAALALDEDPATAGTPDAAARLNATSAYEFAARETIQIHGAIGVTWDHDLHLHYRRSRTLALELGPVFEWEDLIVDALGRAV